MTQVYYGDYRGCFFYPDGGAVEGIGMLEAPPTTMTFATGSSAYGLTEPINKELPLRYQVQHGCLFVSVEV
jgi:hypothetical protein